MTKYPDLFAALAAPFEAEEVRSRSQAGRTLLYITARTAMNRLDDVLGPENWFDEYVPGQNSVMCKLTLRMPDGATITKADAGGYAGMSDSGDDDKSGFSDAFKRAAAKFGVARYLYRDGVPGFARDGHAEGVTGIKPGDDRRPAPQPRHGDNRQQGNRDARPAPNKGGGNAPPKDGRGLFSHLNRVGKEKGFDAVKQITEWGTYNGLPGRIVDYKPEQVSMALGKLNDILKGD